MFLSIEDVYTERDANRLIRKLKAFAWDAELIRVAQSSRCLLVDFGDTTPNDCLRLAETIHHRVSSVEQMATGNNWHVVHRGWLDAD